MGSSEAGPTARRPRLTDVADLAGVSIGTASKALNGAGRMRQDTRERVQEAARRLGFAPDPIARGLVGGRTFTVAVLSTDSFGRFSLPVMLGAEDALGAGEVAVLLCDTRDDPQREAHYVRTLEARRVDGIIVTGRRTESRPLLQTGGDVPVVYAFTPAASREACSVVSDDAGGAATSVDHLVGLGRRRIAIVSGPARHRSATSRAEAAADRLREAGLRPAALEHGPWSEEWGRRAAAQILSAPRGVDAVVCASDQIARGVVDGLQAAGVEVPADVAVTGFDNWDVVALASQPPLTSIDLDLGGLGRRAAELLLTSIDGTDVAGVHRVESRLVVRGSTVSPDGDARGQVGDRRG